VTPSFAPPQFLLLNLAGWVYREQQDVIDYFPPSRASNSAAHLLG
jgi:hypothetical protein